jgi:aryl-alcohol dehydrogenase-like predicted oxidoreductase
MEIGATTLAAAAAAVSTQRATSERARASRQWLARQPAEPAVVRVGPRLAVANLEDRIAWLDDALTDEQLDDVPSTHVSALQQERARLVNSLAQVRYAETLAALN